MGFAPPIEAIEAELIAEASEQVTPPHSIGCLRCVEIKKVTLGD